ncbi:uncharacterized protein Dwil_GK27142 [Drosophila willistoni]|uniref:Uncharacterized protein n=1 Tax=Drosophila willistoni TaxID=7260 RepID=A0A0Q9WR90_DROWI|nr:uncharacterized protein Dwil_GK27142 [Drosophila willistoni]
MSSQQEPEGEKNGKQTCFCHLTKLMHGAWQKVGTIIFCPLTKRAMCFSLAASV